MSLVLHEISRHAVEATLNAEPHAVLLTGPVGSGLATIANYYAKKTGKVVRTVLPEKDERVNLEKGTITIDSIRKLYAETRLQEPKGRIVIIDYAERMGIPAQNAFLKLLEEPNKDTSFILLTHIPNRLLPTITSRAQRVDIRAISASQSESLLDTLKITDATRRSQLLFIASGLPAELTRLATDEDYFNARAAIVRDARDYAKGSAYQKLLVAKKYKDDRDNALVLLQDAMKMIRSALQSEQGQQQVLKTLDRLEHIHTRITEQGNVRLQLSAAVML